MNFTFENQGTNTYLVYVIGEADVVDTMSLGMLTNNRIPGLAATLFTQMDATKYIKYNVSSKVSVNQFFMGPVNKRRLIGVFNGIVDAMLSSEDYMIDVNTILLDLEYIFTDVSTCETSLICLPIQNVDERKNDLSAFFKNIMFSTQFDQTENCDHVAKIINFLNSKPVLSLVEFKELLDDLNKPQVVTTPSPQQTVPPVQTPQPTPVKQAQVSQQPQVSVKPPVTPQQPVTQKNMNPVNMNIPQSAKPIAPKTPDAPKTQGETTEKPMSMMNLLMHYSKENAQLYKEQKAAKKVVSQSVAPKQKAPVPNAGFAIPGQSAPVSMPTPTSVPTPVPTPTPTPAVSLQTVNVYPANMMPQTQSANFGETTVLSGGGIGETTVLGVFTATVEVKPYLIRMKNNEKILLNKPVFRIGKEKSYVDYFIGDNTAISRSHANIVCKDGEYFVVDTNSTNHTYVNGTMLASNVETKVTDGAKIRLANEDFEFKLM